MNLTIEEVIPQVKNGRILEIAKFFKRNCEQTHWLSTLHEQALFRRAFDEQLQRRLERLPSQLAADCSGVSDFPAMTITHVAVKDTIQSIANASINETEFRVSIRRLYQSCVVMAWSAFESAMGDTWIAAVNCRPDLFAHNIWKEFDQEFPDGLSGRRIQLRVLAKYKFNISNCLGTLLSEQMDFTRLRNIAKAYRALRFPADLANQVESEKMKEFRLVRNLIAHRCGIIDETFKRFVNCGEAGEEYKVSQEAISDYLIEAVRVVAPLIKATDDALQA